MHVEWELFLTAGLGDNSYILFSGDEAAIIDPQRDAWRFLEFTQHRGLQLRFVLETHLHNDYVSGALEVRNTTGAEIAAPAHGNYAFPHVPVEEGTEIRLGSARIVCLETPGHTFEHVSWLVYEEGHEDPVALFTGGSLLIGGAGRTDLLGEKHTRDLTKKQYQTIQRYKDLPAHIAILPTHGSGSFCAAGSSRKERVSSLQQETIQNDIMKAASEEQFSEIHLAQLPAYPLYYAYMAPINRHGPNILKMLPQIRSLTPTDVQHTKSWIIDMRNRKEFAISHIPGSINIEMNETLGTYTGWIVPFGEPLLLIPDGRAAHEQIPEAVTQLIRIGYERISGYLDGGIDAWSESHNPVTSYETGTIQDLCNDFRNGELRLIDVRQKQEWDEGHAKESVHAFVGKLAEEMPELPGKDLWSVACASGYRSAMAASILHGRGIPVRLIAEGGVRDFLEACPDAKDQ